MCYVARRANLLGDKVRDHRSADLAYRGVRWNIHTYLLPTVYLFTLAVRSILAVHSRCRYA